MTDKLHQSFEFHFLSFELKLIEFRQEFLLSSSFISINISLIDDVETKIGNMAMKTFL